VSELKRTLLPLTPRRQVSGPVLDSLMRWGSRRPRRSGSSRKRRSPTQPGKQSL